jgi:flavodoxin
MKKGSVLSAYFSHSGNTRAIAEMIHKNAGGNIFEIVSVDLYPDDYDAVVEQAKKELDTDFMPRLKAKVMDMDSYTTVFIGYPNWWGTLPRPVAAFLSEYDFAQKTIAPFCTHEGSDLGHSVADIRKMCPQSSILDGLAIRGGEVKNAQDEVSVWLREIGMTAKSELLLVSGKSVDH